MQWKTISKILTAELAASAKDGHFTLPTGTRLTLFVGQGTGVLAIQKVRGLRKASDYLIVESDDGRVFVDPSQLLSIRADAEAETAEVRVGFV